jgi:hypothetical protein
METNKSLSPRQNIQRAAKAARLLRWKCGPRFPSEATRVERHSRFTAPLKSASKKNLSISNFRQ